jgi:hypothetical protein
MKEVKEILKSSKMKLIICIFGSIFVVLVIFQVGILFGIQKASFSYRTGEQYFRQMNGRPNDQFMGMNRGDFANSHGATGKIISIKLPIITVADKDGTEKNIIISTSTDIRKFRDSIKATDLKINDLITAIGDPDDNAVVEAKLIRIMPDPGSMPIGQTGTSTNK